ncbi:MAG: SDR family oxidoreductase [Xanthomonadaceae bacterium]|jgi:3-oxoacyl-[acyl-carrier protein] reductase|nr:SDR family oxidoreductase [Xanthomonadaceae bacterium]
MDLDLSGKHALVCGASQGIGRAAAVELALLGADVTLLARRADVLRALVDELPRPRANQSHAWLAADLADPAAAAQVEALATQRPVHVLVNNSGGPPPGTVADANAEAFLAAFRQHLLGGHALLQAVLPGMKAARWGRVVNVISTSVKEPIPGIGVSNTIRGAVASWAKTLAHELGPHGITVNNVLPGSTETPRIAQIVAARARGGGRSEDEVRAEMRSHVPAGRFADPSEIGAAIAFLASPAAAYINGINLPVDGGRTQSL